MEEHEQCLEDESGGVDVAAVAVGAAITAKSGDQLAQGAAGYRRGILLGEGAEAEDGAAAVLEEGGRLQTAAEGVDGGIGGLHRRRLQHCRRMEGGLSHSRVEGHDC